MSFKFKLGDLVVHSEKRHHPPAKVEAFHLNGFMRIRARNQNNKYLVREEDYETWNEEENIQSDYQDNGQTTRGRTKVVPKY
jgi:hypothetical protein